MSNAFMTFGNSQFTPTGIPGCYLWLDAAGASNFSLSGSNILQWNDKSGNGFHATTSGNPTYNSSFNRVQFNGTNSYMSNLSYSLNLSQRSIFVMMAEVSRTAFGGVFPQIPNPRSGNDFATTNGLSIETQNGLRFYGNGGGYSNDIGNASLLVQAIYNDNMNMTVGSGFLNGTNVTNVTATYTAGTCAGYALGTRWLGAPTPPNYALNGYIYEVLVYNRPLLTAQRQQIEGYLAWKWGLQRNLPTTHPYYNNQVYTNSPLPLVTGFSAGVQRFQRSTLPQFPTAPTTFQMNNGFFNPRSISGCSLWLDATDSSSITGSPVTSWTDKSGSGNNATASVGPTKSNYNGYPVVSFNGSSQFMISNNSVPKTMHTLIAIHRPAVINGNGQGNTSLFRYQVLGTPYIVFPYMSSTNPRGYITDADGSPLLAGNSTLIENSVTTAFNIIIAVIQSGSQLIFKNGTLQSSNNQSLSGGTSDSLTIGRYPPTNSEFYQGDLGEMIVYPRAITTAQRQQVEGYLAWKWGLQTSLPASHPYSRIPPPP